MDKDIAGSGLLPKKQDPVPTVPEWPEFIRGYVRYRQSLDEQAPDAPGSSQPTTAEGGRGGARAFGMRVLLIHGLGRTPLSLLGLARDLRRAGHRPQLVAYVGAFESYRAIVARVRRRLEAAASTGEPYAAIGHSLGGLLLRTALADWPAELPLPRCVVMLGTPNHPPRLARRFQGWRLYRWINGESGQLLAQPEFFAGLPVPTVRLTVIAGTKGWPSALSLFGGEPNDGVVAVAETLSAHARVVELPASHTFMMNNRDVRALVRELLAAP